MSLIEGRSGRRQIRTEVVHRVHQSTGLDRLQRQRGPLRELSGHQLTDEQRVDVGLIGMDLAVTHEPIGAAGPSAVNPVSHADPAIM